MSLLALPVSAQNPGEAFGNQLESAGDINVFPDFSLGGFGGDTEEPIELSAKYFADASGDGRVEIQASVASFWHIYSTTQKSGGPTPTSLKITSPETVKLTGAFQPDHQPAKSISSDFDGMTIEEFGGVVTWSAPVSMPAGFEDEIEVSVRGLVCKSGQGADKKCMPVIKQIRAQYAGLLSTNPFTMAMDDSHSNGASATTAEEEKVGKMFRDGDYAVQWKAVVSPQQLAPGQTGTLKFTAQPDASFHVYKSEVDDSDSSTNFVVIEKDGLKVGAPVADHPFISKSIVESLPPVSYYHGKVTWSLPIQVPADATAGEKTIEGLIGYQACTDSSCLRPSALKFTAKIKIAEASGNQPSAIELVTTKRSQVLNEASTRKWVDDIKMPKGKEASSELKPANESKENAAPVVAPTSSSSFPTLLLFAFLGGIVLNVMPCVLPVIGLKVMSFVSQAGSDRKRVLTLNLAYCAGIFVVFSALAALAVVFNFGWGEQFQYFSVRLGVTVGLFAFALSYFNVWEIPVPGMASSKTSQDLQNKEGLTGAFSKGVFATLLATPCSGPLLGGVFGATIGLPGAQVVMIFLVMALGMATPYLLIGLNPSWIKWLPKPGPWMETFKQLMAFFFLAAVAFFFYQFSDENKFPVFVTLIGVWFGCWIIGLVPNWQSLKKRLIAWGSGVSIATAIGLSAFFVLKAAPELNWVDYNEASLKQYQNQGKTVLVDFSAKWCVNCLVNLETAIDTRKTRELVDELGVVSMYADWTNYDEAVTKKLTELNSKSIPVLAIYPANRPNEPIILRDLVTQSTVLEALRSAGPSGSTGVVSRGDQTIIASSKH